MTISSTTRYSQANGNGVTLTFPFAFKVFQTTDLVVYSTVIATGVDTLLTLNTDYTVSLNADQNYNPGGNIVFYVAPASTVKLTISSAVPNLQPTDLSNQGGFYPDVINDSFDRSTIQIQQVSNLNARGLVTPISDGVSTNLTLPSIANRANKYLAFDASGVPMGATGTNTPGVSFPGNVELTANNGGSNVARDLVFYDNTTERMRLLGATGRLGIGTASPSAALDVVGSANVSGTVTAATLSVTNALVSAAMASGSVLQVVSASTTTTYTLTTSYGATSLAVTITPKRSTSTIYLIASASFYNATSGAVIDAKFVRTAGTLDVGEHLGILTQTGTTPSVKANVMMLASDAPATTSATTYTLHAKTSATVCEFSRSSSRSTMFAIEVAT